MRAVDGNNCWKSLELLVLALEVSRGTQLFGVVLTIDIGKGSWYHSTLYASG